MDIEKGEKGQKSRVSLYLEKEKTHEIDDMRLLMALDGRNMRSVPEFTDMIDAIIYYAYRKTFPKVDRLLLKEFISNPSVDLSEKDSDPFLNALENSNIKSPYSDAIKGYDAKIYILKEDYKALIDSSIININKEADLIIEYSEFIKKSIDFVLKNLTEKWSFFESIYIGNLYGFSPILSLKLSMLNENDEISYMEITQSELKQIKLLNSDFAIVNKLTELKQRARKLWDIEDQSIFLRNFLLKERGLFKSILWDFNYGDAFYGYIYSKLYLYGAFKNIENFIEKLEYNQIFQRVMWKKTKYKFTDGNTGKIKLKKESLLTHALDEFTKDLYKLHNIAQLSLMFDINEAQDIKSILNEIRKKASELFGKI